MGQHLGETSSIKDTFKYPGFQRCTEGPATTDVSQATRSPRAITAPATVCVCVSAVTIFPTPKIEMQDQISPRALRKTLGQSTFSQDDPAFTLLPDIQLHDTS